MRPLGPREVRVLLVDLLGDPTGTRNLLSPDELARADRFVLPLHRRRFTNARATLRRTLGTLLDAEPAKLELAYGERGKPELPAHPELHFNLSHSGERALIAATLLAPVGIDVEEHRPIELEGIARRTFSDAELAALLQLPEHERFLAFFRIWSRKEAVVKAVGLGIGADLRGFDVPIGSGASGLRAIRWPGDRAKDWTLIDIDAGPGAAAAVAVAHPHADVEMQAVYEHTILHGAH